MKRWNKILLTTLYSPFTRKAFTLAEVLITVGIIGVVAAMTIPTLMNSIQENNYKVAYKKAFSVASQAWQSAYADNMMEPRGGWESNVSNYDNFNQFMTKFDIIKTCDSTTGFSGCWATNENKDALYNLPFTGGGKEVCFLDKSGMAWCNAGSWGYMVIDTNGLQKPNIYGKDRWALAECDGRDRYDKTNGCVIPGISNAIKPFPDYNYNQYICPAGATHPCNYTSWLYN